LKDAGFTISPAERLRVMRVIDHFGKNNLESPEQLKTLLCPILAQGKVGQAKFYDLFDQYWAQVMQPWEPSVVETPPTVLQKNDKLLRWLLVALILGGLAYAFYLLNQVSDPLPLKASFRNPNQVMVEDSVYFENLSENTDSLCIFQWDIFDDLESDGEPEFTTTDSFHLTYLISKMGKSPFKKVRLTSIHPVKGDTAVFEGKFTILCNDPPKIDSVAVVTEAEIDQPVDFKVFTKNDKGLKVSWDMGDTPYGEEAVLETSSAIKHTYKEDGQYQIRLNVTREGAEGYCQIDTFFTIKIGGEKAYLAAKTLQKDTISAIVNFSYGLWVLMGLLGLPIIWFWVKWAARPEPKPIDDQNTNDLEAAARRFQSSDKAPYKIPFRSHNRAVQVDKDMYRLADIMRQRKEGLRKEMDVPTSVKRTIAEGGFPQLLTKADEVPTEYLFLIDGQFEGSHQRHLFQWLVGFLQQREVLGDVFFYNDGLQRYWNQHFPDGISPGQLQRMYSFHKLVVLGDGHNFVDPTPNFERHRPQLLPAANNLFGHWKHRFLLTPMPVISWTYREGVLHDRFAIFPLDMAGLNHLIKYLEHEVEDEERPPYKMWSEKLLENRQEVNTNYHNWRTAADHKEYLKAYPELYKWLAAIALYPKPEWNMTLAIGRALLPVGVEVTYDNLLVLSRIPWLITGDLSPNLRHQLIESLDKETEYLARQAIESELSAVTDAVKDGHANLEHQTNLALQQFALDPKDAEVQKSIQQLMALGLLTPRHFVEINQLISRQSAVGSGQSALGGPAAKMDRSPDALKAYLEENKAKPEAAKKPFFTRDFWWATLLSLLFIALFLIGWNYGATDELAKIAGIDINDSTDCQEEYSHFYFLKKECIADSAVVLNNQAVGIWENMAGDATEKTPVLIREVNKINLDLADSLLSKAIALRPNYDIAISNKEKLTYNIGVQEYHSFFSDSSGQDGLQKAIEYFNKIQLDSFKLDAMHGKGLAEYYIERSFYKAPEIAKSIYSQMLLQDSQYFNKITTYPHLQSLLAIKKNIELKIIDAGTKLPISDVLITDKRNNRFRSNEVGKVEIKMVMGERREFEFNKKGYEKLNQTIIDSSGVFVYEIALVKIPETPVVVEGNLPKGDVEFCYVYNGRKYTGYFSVDYELFKDGQKIPFQNVIMSLGSRLSKYEIKAKVNNLNLAEAAHYAEIEIDFFLSEEFSESTGVLAKVRNRKLTIKSFPEITFEIVNNPNEPNLNPLVLGVIKRNNCTIDFQGSGEKEVASGCVLGMVFNAKNIIYDGDGWVSGNNRYFNQLIENNKSEINKKLTGLSCLIADDIFKKGELTNFDSELKKVFYLVDVEVDRDGDTVPDKDDKCPTIKGNVNNNGCENVDIPIQQNDVIPQNEKTTNWRLIKSNFIAEPKILKNRDFYDTFEYDRYEYKIILNELSGKGQATFSIEKDLKMEARYVAPVTIEGMLPGEERTFEMDRINFRLKYTGQERKQIGKLEREVSLYELYVDMNSVGYKDPFDLEQKTPDLDRLLKELEANMVFVEGGTFQMGCDPKRDGECQENELPLHEVSLSSFSIGKYEVTQELWEAVMGTNPSNFKNCPQCPVENVSWNDVQDFLKKLNDRTGQKYRLPTEAEWEYAAKGGNRNESFQYAGSNELDKVAWFSANSNNKTHPVGQKYQNMLGLYDMSGNVWEWCSDWYGDNYYKLFENSKAINPKGPATAKGSVVRGGSWTNVSISSRVVKRFWEDRTDGFPRIGFRLALD
jgi:formylglycine-generating enzyme required for sulfatase activity